MYGSKYVGILAFNYIVNNLVPFRYHPVKHAPGLWKYETRSITYTLYVGDFGINSYSKEDKEHLISALKTKYEISIDFKGANYIGLNINWNYKENMLISPCQSMYRELFNSFYMNHLQIPLCSIQMNITCLRTENTI